MKHDQVLAFRIKSLDNQIRRLLERTAIAQNDANLTGTQYAILGFLCDRMALIDLYQRDVEAEFNIRRSTASAMLKSLEKQGYIRRVSVSSDARLKKIIVTERAKEVDTVAKKNIDQLQKKLTQGISPEEIKQFNKILKKISDNAKQ